MTLRPLHVWRLICRQPLVWRCSDWPRCTEMRFGSSGYTGATWE